MSRIPDREGQSWEQGHSRSGQAVVKLLVLLVFDLA